jgi:hypothetical protein
MHGRREAPGGRFTCPLPKGNPGLTARGEGQSMRRFAVTCLAALSLLGASGVAVAAARAVPPFPRLPGTWSHAEINITINRKPHTLILDRGRITQSSTSQLTVKERNGVFVVVPLSQRTIVNLNGYPSSIYSLGRGMNAQTMRIDGGSAVRVRASS